MVQFIRGKQNGIILDYQERLANHPLFEVISEQEAYPERFAPVKFSEREQKITLDIPEAVVKPQTISPELEIESTKRLRTPRMAQATKITGNKGEK